MRNMGEEREKNEGEYVKELRKREGEKKRGI